MDTNLVSAESWQASYKDASFQRLTHNNEIYKLIRKYVPSVSHNESHKTVLEIGSFPGTYISEFGELGYVLNGVDLEPKNKTELPKYLEKQNYKIGEFYSCKVEDLNTDKKFDVVCSFGFIEHFTNFEEIAKLHATFVKENGYLVLTAPNFRGLLQYVMHKFFAPNDFKNHFIPSMNPKKWLKAIENQGFNPLFCGYFGGFNFWIHNEKKSFIKKQLYRISLKLLTSLGTVIKGDSLFFSKQCGLIAIKKS